MKLLPIAAAVVFSATAWAQTPPPQPPAATTPAQPAPAMDESKRVSAEEIDKLMADGKVLLLDVREPKELEELGTIPDSINIPIGQLEKRLGELPKDRLILTA
jgi:3-mercaptopyruvate sulfurtransferase SseA